MAKIKNIFSGVIIEESLVKKEILKKINISKTKITKVTKKHQTPWIKQWTLHTVEIPENQIDDIVHKLSWMLDQKHPWYSDFKNDCWHYIIFRKKIFKVNRTKPAEYKTAIKYGISLGIPYYQLDFSL